MNEAVSVICRHYNYTLYDIFQRKWKDGGITFDQLQVLYDNIQKQLLWDIEMQANIHGAELVNSERTTKKAKSATEFQDQSAYDHLSIKEKKELTKQMMGKHRQMFTSKK